MNISVFDIFKIGIGPSSSHTVGPMKAAYHFITTIRQQQKITTTTRILVELYGSLALTGIGHGTDGALLAGLEGHLPEQVNPELVLNKIEALQTRPYLSLLGQYEIPFHIEQDLLRHRKEILPLHSNGMRLTAFNAHSEILWQETYYSIGGGFVVTETEFGQTPTQTFNIPYPFNKARELLAHCFDNNLSIAEIMLANECCFHTASEISAKLQHISHVMFDCIERGCHSPGILPGGLNVKRRAPDLYGKLQAIGKPKTYEHADSLQWINAFAMAVNEENAAGGRVVTAPTNGAAGIIPAVLFFYHSFYPQATKADTEVFLLTAAAIAALYKKGASISGAEVGCQGEVGVAASMAAAALTAVLGGNVAQIENAAEIAMEHSLGMTCDPIGGLVQIPCIERNAMGANKAVNASRIALMGDGSHIVSLDKVIATMKQTGKDMMTIYKETSLGGLAVNIPDC